MTETYYGVKIKACAYPVGIPHKGSQCLEGGILKTVASTFFLTDFPSRPQFCLLGGPRMAVYFFVEF